MKENLRYLFLLFPIIGIGVFVGGVVYRRRLKSRLADCERIQGAVVGEVSQTNPAEGTTVYLPVVEYSVGNRRFKVTGDAGYSSPLKKGAPLTVMFRPQNPSEAYVEKNYYLAANVLLLVGSGFVLLGSFLAYVFCVSP